MSSTRLLVPDRLWTGDDFELGRSVLVAADGTIGAVLGPEDPPPPDVEIVDLAGRALLPGFVNAHSHAFQRALRGRGETFPAGAGSFWSWREAMYGLVERLDAGALREICLRAFREMLSCGITTVGEFHYLHHLGDPRSDAAFETPAFAADAIVLEAAREAGIRMVLLQAAYRHGGLEDETYQPLSPAQRRFDTVGLETYEERLDVLDELRDPATQSLGVVAHSIRAVAPDELAALHDLARRRGLVFHLHLEEQRREIDACRAAHGRTPMAVLLEAAEIGSETTAVHCTHTDRSEMERYLEAGGNVCLCPLTEADLGDGIADLPAIYSVLDRRTDAAGKGHQLALGTDSNARISMLEEMRWAEHVQRLARERRGVARDAEGRCGRRLLHAATVGGARTLGLDAGEIAPGRPADLVVVDLRHPSLQGLGDGTPLEDALVFGTGDGVIGQVWVGGRKIPLSGRGSARE